MSKVNNTKIIGKEYHIRKKWFVTGISIFAVILLTLTSLTNVVGYQSVQSSNQSIIKERINQRELLFQTICDITNNKEIQRIIIKSQISRGIFPPSEMPVVTKNQLKMMYFLGMILSKVISKSRIQSMIQKYQFNNQDIQKEITTVIEKDSILNAEITLLKNSNCDCENDRQFPKICEILTVFVNIIDRIAVTFPPSYLLFIITLPYVFVVVVLYCFVFNCINIPY